MPMSLLLILISLLISIVSSQDASDDEYDPFGNRIALNWADRGIVNTPIGQKSCGSCWSFVVTGMLEAKYAQLTGHLVKFSEGFLVDCVYPFSGCAGGHHADGIQKVQEIQYIPTSENYPWKGYWSGKCLDPNIDHRRPDNALKDVWVTFHHTVPARLPYILDAINDETVGVGLLISKDFGGYRSFSEKDIFDDKNCISDHLGHGMLLVGYTPDAWILKNSYGSKWGINGFVHARRHAMIERCQMFNNAVTVGMAPRREIEYQLVKGLYTFKQGRKACRKLSTPGRSGWTLAEIPTAMHNGQLLKLFRDKYGTKKKKNKKGKDFNRFWIGLSHEDITHFQWEDSLTPLQFIDFKNNKPIGGEVAMSKLSGKWSSAHNKIKMRITCSRYLTCRPLRVQHILNADSLTFSDGNNDGSDVVAVCKEGFKIKGNYVGSCLDGIWTLPSCE